MSLAKCLAREHERMGQDLFTRHLQAAVLCGCPPVMGALGPGTRCVAQVDVLVNEHSHWCWVETLLPPGQPCKSTARGKTTHPGGGGGPWTGRSVCSHSTSSGWPATPGRDRGLAGALRGLHGPGVCLQGWADHAGPPRPSLHPSALLGPSGPLASRSLRALATPGSHPMWARLQSHSQAG